MKNSIKLNHEKGLIIMDKTFSKLAENARSEEYSILQSVRKDYPDYIVTKREIKKNSAQEHYKGLTYDYMRRYISTHEEEDSAEMILDELEEMINISHCHSQSRRYPVIKKWFLEKYAQVLEFGVENQTDAADSALSDFSLKGAAE